LCRHDGGRPFLVSGLKPNRRTNARIARGTGRSTPLLRRALATVVVLLDSATASAAMVLSAAIGLGVLRPTFPPDSSPETSAAGHWRNVRLGTVVRTCTHKETGVVSKG
jgi:hypothetical protein